MKGAKRERQDDSSEMDCEGTEACSNEQQQAAQKQHRSAASSSAPQDAAPAAVTQELKGACMVYVGSVHPVLCSDIGSAHVLMIFCSEKWCSI